MRNETAAAVRRRGEALGMHGAALDLFVRKEARRRHDERVMTARLALFEGALALGVVPDGTDLLPLAVFLWALEMVGCGGPKGLGVTLGPPATARIPALRHLGTGRKNAGDGDAWSAAIRDAFAPYFPNPGNGMPSAIMPPGDPLKHAALHNENHLCLSNGAAVTPIFLSATAAPLNPQSMTIRLVTRAAPFMAAEPPAVEIDVHARLLIVLGYGPWLKAYAGQRILDGTAAWAAVYNAAIAFPPGNVTPPPAAPLPAPADAPDDSGDYEPDYPIAD